MSTFKDTVEIKVHIPNSLYPSIKNYQRHLQKTETNTNWPVQSVVYRLIKEAIFNCPEVQQAISKEYELYKSEQNKE